MSFTTIISTVSLNFFGLNFLMIFIQLDLTFSMSYFKRESLESTNDPLMATVVAVKSMLVPVDTSVVHNNIFAPKTVTFSLKLDEEFVKLPVFTVVPNVLSIDNKTEGVVELSGTKRCI